ncbi:DsrE family protein [Sphingomonas japonica]|uniref:Peroxiredoxin n=1 Tax=Sphingomonas japonica TaxID=511662 RepID=A0ABX0U6E7_9SPHN|nr:DsrE family protein [Sphingomonas japonica]NIJ24986.1 putative peroxiredoxin [Sphingomonas japonica]
MSGLTILIISADRERGHAALLTALAAAALGTSVRMFFQGHSVRLLQPGAELTPLLAETKAAGVKLVACQTGLADARVPFDALIEGVEPGGLVSMLADGPHDRLLAF